MIALYIVLGVLTAVFGIIILHVLFLCVLALFVHNKEYDKADRFYRSVVLYFMRLILFFSHVKIKTAGKDKIDKIDGRFLLVGNHRSNYDPFIIVNGLKLKETAFISKPENFKIPLAGRILRKCLYLSIDRENAKNALKTINRAAELMKAGEISYCVYPEGTRNKGENLLPFHDGVFKIAQKAEVPVVVVAAFDADKIRKNAPFRKTTVRLDVIDVISAEEVKKLSSHELGDKVYKELSKALNAEKT